MTRNDTERMALDGMNRNGKGRPYENLMARAMAAYCIKNGIPYRTVTGTKEDRFKGTDFRVYGMLDIWTADAGILRLDFTSAFSAKDNMPLLWIPSEESKLEQMDRHPYQYGIRTGNSTAGFDEPVIVIGIDASRNDDPDDNIDVELMSRHLMSSATRHAPSILFNAGQALAAYGYMSEPRYRAWLDQRIADGDEDLWQPDVSGLVPNYKATAENLATRRPTYVTASGIRTAQECTTRHMVSLPDGSKLKTAAEAHWKMLDGVNSPKARRIAPPSMSWMEQLNKALARMAEDDKNMQPDGLTK